jgi:hypothetical protein
MASQGYVTTWWSESPDLFAARGHSELDANSKAAVENHADWSIAAE